MRPTTLTVSVAFSLLTDLNVRATFADGFSVIVFALRATSFTRVDARTWRPFASLSGSAPLLPSGGLTVHPGVARYDRQAAYAQVGGAGEQQDCEP